MSQRATLSGQRWATEIQVDHGYVVDALVLASLQVRFWDQLFDGDRARPKMQPPKLVHIFETKISRGDFLAKFHPKRDTERKKPKGNLHYVVAPQHLIDPIELPDFWGLLEQSGRGLREVKRPTLLDIPEIQLWNYSHQILWHGYGRRATIEDWELKRDAVAANTE